MSQTKAINRVFPLTSHPNKITSINRLSYEWLDSVRDRRRELEGRRGTSSSIFPMIKADPNCFDNIKDFVTGSRRAVRGADRSWRLRVAGTAEERGWCVTSRNRNSSETSHVVLVERRGVVSRACLSFTSTMKSLTTSLLIVSTQFLQISGLLWIVPWTSSGNPTQFCLLYKIKQLSCFLRSYLL